MQKILKKKSQNNTPEEQAFIENYLLADGVYASVVGLLNIPKNDEVYLNLVTGILKRQTMDHIVFTIWSNLDKGQMTHLRNLINWSVEAPLMPQEELLVDFALMYPDLIEKINASLTPFFQNFIKKFNEIANAS